MWPTNSNRSRCLPKMLVLSSATIEITFIRRKNCRTGFHSRRQMRRFCRRQVRASPDNCYGDSTRVLIHQFVSLPAGNRHRPATRQHFRLVVFALSHPSFGDANSVVYPRRNCVRTMGFKNLDSWEAALRAWPPVKKALLNRSILTHRVDGFVEVIACSDNFKIDVLRFG